MEKDTITLEAIKEDLLKLERHWIFGDATWHFGNVLIFAPILSIIGIAIENLVAWLIIALFPMYHLLRFTVKYVKYRIRKKAIRYIMRREDISISTEIFSHIAGERTYRPHIVGTRLNLTQVVQKYYFTSGAEWVEPLGFTHYEWSENYYVSPKGLENSTSNGDEFYYIHLQGHLDVAYIYPCKNFSLSAAESLRTQWVRPAAN